jgi:hypothetical protein
MTQVTTYVDDFDAAVPEAVAKQQGLSLSPLIRTMVRAAVDAAPQQIKVNARAALEERDSLSVSDFASGWAGETERR